MTKSNNAIPFINLKTGLLSACILSLIACGGGGGGGSKSSSSKPASSSATSVAPSSVAPSSSSAASSIAPDEGMTLLKTDGPAAGLRVLQAETAQVPDALWAELKAEGLIRADAPV